MKVMSFSAARANLAATLDSVIDDAEEVLITRAGHEPVVVMSQREYESMREMQHLQRYPAMVERLNNAIAELNAGRGQVHELIEA